MRIRKAVCKDKPVIASITFLAIEPQLQISLTQWPPPSCFKLYVCVNIYATVCACILILVFHWSDKVYLFIVLTVSQLDGTEWAERQNLNYLNKLNKYLNNYRKARRWQFPLLVMINLQKALGGMICNPQGEPKSLNPGFLQLPLGWGGKSLPWQCITLLPKAQGWQQHISAPPFFNSAVTLWYHDMWNNSILYKLCNKVYSSFFFLMKAINCNF